MKKLLSLVLALAFILCLFGCNNGMKKEYCYVAQVMSDGFVADITGLGKVFVEYPDADKQIELFDTVIIKYGEEDIVEEIGTFVHITGNEDTWSYRIRPKKLRVADPTKGDLVFS